MEPIYIFKYQDTVDLNHAFVLSDTEENARKAIVERTSIPIVLIGTRSAVDFPKIWEEYSYKRTGDTFIYKNDILPF